MKIELTKEQIDKIYNGYLEIDLDDGAGLYFEFNSSDKSFLYGEIFNPKGIGRREKFCFDAEDLGKLIPKKPTDPSYYHNAPLCPTCGTYMIYNFEHCPKCGQELRWSEFTGDR